MVPSCIEPIVLAGLNQTVTVHTTCFESALPIKLEMAGTKVARLAIVYASEHLRTPCPVEDFANFHASLVLLRMNCFNLPDQLSSGCRLLLGRRGCCSSTDERSCIRWDASRSVKTRLMRSPVVGEIYVDCGGKRRGRLSLAAFAESDMAPTYNGHTYPLQAT